MGELTSEEQKKLQAQGYFTEYQAIMTRMNTFMAMQFVPIGPWILFLSFTAVPALKLERFVIVWGDALVTQIAILVYGFALHEVYAQARHIEGEIKPRVALLLDLELDAFWSWERAIFKHGKANPIWPGDVTPAIICLIAFGSACVFADWPVNLAWNGLGCVLSVALMFMGISQAWRIAKVRRDLVRSTRRTLQDSIKHLVLDHRGPK